MAIRLRTVDGMLVALCAATCPAEPGDFYLDDDQHYAIALKYGREWGRFDDAETSRRVAAIEGEDFCNPVNPADYPFPLLSMAAD